MDLFSLFFITHENYEIKSPTKIYDFTVYVYFISFIARRFVLQKLTGAKSNFEIMFQQELNLGIKFDRLRVVIVFRLATECH